jgi:hypothetical protein
MVGIGLFAAPGVSSADSMAATKEPSSLLEKVIPPLPHGFSARSNDPWGHKMGEQTADQFAAYYGPTWIPPGFLQEGGLIDAYSEFASANTHRKSDYLTISLVRLTNEAQAAELTSYFEEAQTNSLTPAPGGGWVKKVTVSGIPGSQAYLSWFEGSADSDIVFDRGGVVVDVERSTPSKAVAADSTHFAQQIYRKLKIDAPSLT